MADQKIFTYRQFVVRGDVATGPDWSWQDMNFRDVKHTIRQHPVIGWGCVVFLAAQMSLMGLNAAIDCLKIFGLFPIR